MASTNKTSNLELSQFISTDTPTWLVDYNGDMEKIDAGVGRVEELAETASTQAVGVASGLQTTNQTVTTLSGQVANVQNQANTTTSSVNGINQRLGNADISGIGDGTITGAIISVQNSNLKWKLIGSCKPSDISKEFSIPSEATEILLAVKSPDTNGQIFTSNVPLDLLDESKNQDIVFGYGSNNQGYDSQAVAHAIKSKVTLYSICVNKSPVDFTFYVYYK